MSALLHAPWMQAPPVRRILSVLNGERRDSARFVGGCVRNTLLGEPVSDIDIATQLTPDVVTQIMSGAGARVHPTGIEHGTVTVVVDHHPFEVTTLRRDVQTDGRRAVVSFTEDWSEDAHRRDFRLNALYCDERGVIHDPTGSGVTDARSRRIVFIGDPEARIREDYLRILRFFRFSAWYGRRVLNADGLAACSALRGGLDQISPERIWMELRKLLAAPEPSFALRGMAQAGVLHQVLPEAHGLELLERLVALERRAGLSPQPLRRFMSLFSKDREVFDTVSARLRLSNEEKGRLASASMDSTPIRSTMTPAACRRAVFLLGEATFTDRLVLAWAASGDPSLDGAWVSLLTLAQKWKPPQLPVSGDDVLAVGVPAGPRVGEVLRQVEAWWIDGDFRADRASTLSALMRFVR
ncbi:CCA tRNA nucleotidyltransferase [bacterium]|nr:CCA tRNA nucleotidyltransferase [bacterium]